MSDPYIGEIRMFGGNFAPVGWSFCNGQLLSISEYTALFQLIGTTYGGDGVSTFALPDLRGRLPISQGTGQGGSYALGQAAGTETVTLTTAQMPAHAHSFVGSTAEVEVATPANGVFATSADTPFYAPYNPGKGATLNAAVVGSAGGSQPHDNMMPSLCVTFIIALEGIYPQQG
jgi:microcystin-dependent protein